MVADAALTAGRRRRDTEEYFLAGGGGFAHHLDDQPPHYVDSVWLVRIQMPSSIGLRVSA